MRVLFRGGRREADPPVVVAEAVGEGVEEDISRSALAERIRSFSGAQRPGTCMNSWIGVRAAKLFQSSGEEDGTST